MAIPKRMRQPKSSLIALPVSFVWKDCLGLDWETLIALGFRSHFGDRPRFSSNRHRGEEKINLARVCWHGYDRLVEPSQAKKHEPTPFQRFDTLARQIIKVPKAVVDRRAAKAKIQRERKRRAGK